MEGGYTSVEFHPDGLILGAGTKDSTVRIWEVRQQQVIIPSELASSIEVYRVICYNWLHGFSSCL